MIFRIGPSGLLLFYSGLLCFMLSSRPAVARPAARIAVTVTNRTTGEALPAQEVVLRRHISEADTGQVVSRGVTDRAGRHVFAALPADSARYAVTTRYRGVDYTTPPLVMPAGGARRDEELDVYATTAKETAIRVEAHHLIVEVTPAAFAVTEIIVFRNSGNETFVPAGRAAAPAGLRLPMPASAFQIQPLSDGIASSAQGMFYTRPVPPGTAQVAYAYSLERSKTDDLISEKMAYDTDRFQALITPSTLKVTGKNVSSQGVRRIGDKDYLLLSNASGLQRGMTFELRFPHETAWQDMMKWGVLGLAAVLFIAGAAAPSFLKREPDERRKKAAPERSPVDRAQAQEAFDDLIRKIAALDDRYEAEDIDPKTYHRRRKNLKRRAINIRMAEVADA